MSFVDIVMLAGAGLSQPAGLPLASELLGAVTPALSDESQGVVERTRLYMESWALDHEQPRPDIEAVVDALQLLASRDLSSVGPWLAGGDVATAECAQRAVLEILDALPDALCPTGSLDYLRPIARFAHYRELAIVTLNYDLLLETVLLEHRVPTMRGLQPFEHEPSYDYFDCHRGLVQFQRKLGVRLVKLHGSTDWWEYDIGFAANAGMGRAIFTGPGYSKAFHDYKSRTLAVILGGSNKLRADGLFPGLWKEAYESVSSARRLVVAGYSFRDNHINELIRRFASQRPASPAFGPPEIVVLSLSADDVRTNVRTARQRGALFPFEFSVHYGGTITEQSLAAALEAPIIEFERCGF